MNSETIILAQLCDENVYRRNAFHVLGLQTCASPKAVRRRKEDFESANELGGESWEREFPHWLSNAELPTFQQVCDAFAFIEDPANRLISEFFWIWSVDENDASVVDFLAGRRDKAMESWYEDSWTYGRRRAVARHNLAVANHALAIEGEMVALSGGADATAKSATLEHWRKGFAYWEELADDDEFWELYEKRMREFDDPRLTGGFVRRIRQEFPIAFDDINARIAYLYARRGDEDDARRHVEYMKQTMNGIDDVEESFDKLFEPLERQIARVVAGCRVRVEKDAEEGAACVDEILRLSTDIVRAANFLLDKSNARRQRILSEIFGACNGFLVAFGNKTEKWDVCAKLNRRLMPLACTPELKKRVTENQKIIQGNLDRQLEDRICAGCGKKDGEKRRFGGVVRVESQKVKMYGNIQRNYESFGGVGYSVIEIGVPCCDKCKPLTNEQLLRSKPIALAVRDGFRIGEMPTQADMRKAWGLPEIELALSAQRVGCLIPILAAGFLAALAGCVSMY